MGNVRRLKDRALISASREAPVIIGMNMHKSVYYFFIEKLCKVVASNTRGTLRQKAHL